MERLLNTPVEVLRVPVPDARDKGVMRETKLTAAALPMRRAMEWLEEAKRMDARIAAADSGNEDPVKVLADVAEFVAAYNPNWPADAICENATAVQIVEALYLLRELNDPFAVAKARKQAEEDRGLRMFEALAKANPQAVQGLIDKHSQLASADSQKSSE